MCLGLQCDTSHTGQVSPAESVVRRTPTLSVTGLIGRQHTLMSQVMIDECMVSSVFLQQPLYLSQSSVTALFCQTGNDVEPQCGNDVVSSKIIVTRQMPGVIQSN